MKKYILKQKYTLFLAVFLTLFCSFLNILIVYIIQNLVDSITKTEISTFQWMLFLLLLVLITNFIIGYVSIFVEAKISKKIHLDLKQDLFQSVLCQKYEDFRLTSTGSKISVFENDINFLEEYYFNNIFVLMRNTIVLTVSLIYLFLLNIVVGIILLISAFLVLLIPLLLGKNIDVISEKYSRKKGEFISGLKDFFEGMDVIHDYQIEKQTYKNYSDILNNLENQLFILKKKIGLYNQTMVFGNYIIIAVSFIAGGYLVINKVISIGEMIAITQVMNIIMQPVGEVVSALIEMTGSKSVKKKLENMIEIKERDSNKDLLTSSIVFSEIECNNISFSRDNSDFSLKNISLKIAANKKYILIGPSGCGKTTLLKLIANTLEPTTGSLYINDKNYQCAEEDISNVISFVHQDTFIFNDSIENNVKLYQNYSDEAFYEAVSIAGLSECLNNRVDLKCTEGGNGLSGGEKQRIAIARAILRNSPVLLLDEITSSLDKMTAKKIVRNLFEMEEKTIVFVTHKLEKEFFKMADCILCIDQGTIIEKGTWHDLIQEKGYFYKLYGEE